jgi:hypothetical protein
LSDISEEAYKVRPSSTRHNLIIEDSEDEEPTPKTRKKMVIDDSEDDEPTPKK